MKLLCSVLALTAQAENQPCGPRLSISNFSGANEDLNGLWTFAMDDAGGVMQNDGRPYYSQEGGTHFMWWMLHGDAIGHWVINEKRGQHGGDRIKTEGFKEFDCPQFQDNWVDAANDNRPLVNAADGDFELIPNPCCSKIDWNNGEQTVTWTKLAEINEEYPIYNNENGDFMWWMWHGGVGHWVINKTPGAHGGDILKSKFETVQCPNDIAEWEDGQSTMACQAEATAEDQEIPEDLSEAFCNDEISSGNMKSYTLKGKRAKMKRRGQRSYLYALTVGRAKESKIHTGLIAYGVKHCGEDFVQKLASGEVTIDLIDNEIQYTMEGHSLGQTEHHQNVVFQYHADQGDCEKCLGTNKSDKLEVFIRGTDKVDWGNKDPEACILSVRNGHYGSLGKPKAVDSDHSGCVAWTNKYGQAPTKKWLKRNGK